MPALTAAIISLTSANETSVTINTVIAASGGTAPLINVLKRGTDGAVFATTVTSPDVTIVSGTHYYYRLETTDNNSTVVTSNVVEITPGRSFRGRPEAFAVTTIVPVITCEHQGFAISGATWTSATKTLTKTGAFTGYTYASGDTILIDGGTGITKGRYKIASKTSNDAIVLHASIGSDAANVSSRLGFESPYPLVVSAHLSTFDGSVAKMDVAEYWWNFGDGNSSEVVTNWIDSPTNTPDLRTNDQAWSPASSGVSHPKAVHVYRTAGTYTIILYVRVGTKIESVTKQITISDWIDVTGDTMYFDPVNGNNANDGLSSGAPKKNDEAAFRTQFNGGPNRRILFMSSGTITLTDILSIQSNGVRRARVLPYNGDSSLILTLLATVDAVPMIKGQISTTDDQNVWGDIVFENVVLDGAGLVSRNLFTFISGGGTTTTAECRGLRMLNCTLKNATLDRVQLDGPGIAWTVFYKCFIDGNDQPGLDIFGSNSSYTTVVGCQFRTNVGNPGNTLTAHFIYPSGWIDGLIGYCYGIGGYGRNFFINGDNDIGTQSRFVITNNRISAVGLSNGIDISTGGAPVANEPRGFVDIVVSSKTGTVAVNDAVTQKNSGATGWVRTAPAGAGTLQVWTHDTTLWTRNALDLVEKTAGVNYYTPDGSTNVVQTAARLLDDVLIQGNAFSGFSGRCVSPTCGLYFTFRENKVWNCVGILSTDSVFTGQLIARLYRNKIYIPNGDGIHETGSLGAHLWVSTAIASYVFLQNQIADANTNNSTGYLLRHQTGTNTYSTVDANQIEFKTLTTPYRNEATTSALTVAQWQALGYDTNSTYAPLSWTDPANGNFTVLSGGRGEFQGIIGGGVF